MNKGHISQIIGPVVDVQFEDNQIPAIYNALTVESNYSTAKKKAQKLTLEVQQHLGDGVVRAVAMSSTDGLQRGLEVYDTASPISVPVGEEVLGRLFNVTGDVIDEKPDVKT